MTRREKIKQGLLELRRATVSTKITDEQIEAITDTFGRRLKKLKEERITDFFEMVCDTVEYFPTAATLRNILMKDDNWRFRGE